MEWATFEVSGKIVLAVGGLCYPVILAGAATDSVDLLLTQIGSLLSLVSFRSPAISILDMPIAALSFFGANSTPQSC